MRVLVTGGLGVNGAWVMRELLQQGHQAISVDNRDDVSLVSDIVDDVTRQIADIRDLDQLTNLFLNERVECVAHLAAVIAAEENPYLGFGINAHGTVTVLEAARRAGVPRVVFTSSKAVYGSIEGEYGYPTYRPIAEDHPRAPFPPLPVYSASKLLSEDAGRFYRDRYGLEFAALRFATIFGPGKLARHGPIGVLSQVVENATLGKPTAVESGADERDDVVYVRDVAQAIVRACTAPRLDSWAYNVGSGRVVSLQDLAASVKRQINDVEITIGPGLDYMGLGKTYGRLDISRAQRELGYAPRFDLDAGVADYVATMERLGLRPEHRVARSTW